VHLTLNEHDDDDDDKEKSIITRKILYNTVYYNVSSKVVAQTIQ